MISLKNLNPENLPDDFERKALELFEQGEREHWQIDKSSGKPVFRYIFPLVVEEPCLACHRRQGYKLGDIRGGVSIMIPGTGLVAQMRTNRNQIVIDIVSTIGILLAIIYFLTWKLVGRLDETQKRLKHIAVTDELTGIKNRRHIMEQMNKEYQRAVRTGGALSLILLDIDNFKIVNDTHGHAFGDKVLQAVAKEMEDGLRSYDLLGRIGGEEFLIASPGSTLDDAAGLAERIRLKIKGRKIPNRTEEITVTVSAGVTSFNERDGKAEAILKRADDALYLAKKQGRDRVVAV
jgi:diguanylate cyclase (GGDEF)-like protein